MKKAPYALAGLLLLTLGGCGRSSASPAPAPGAPAPEPATAAAAPVGCPEKPGLCLVVEPAAAELIVDGTSHGAVESLGPPGARFLAVQPGIHLISLRHEGFETWRAEVSLAERPEAIEVELQAAKPTPNSPNP